MALVSIVRAPKERTQVLTLIPITALSWPNASTDWSIERRQSMAMEGRASYRTYRGWICSPCSFWYI